MPTPTQDEIDVLQYLWQRDRASAHDVMSYVNSRSRPSISLARAEQVLYGMVKQGRVKTFDSISPRSLSRMAVFYVAYPGPPRDAVLEALTYYNGISTKDLSDRLNLSEDVLEPVIRELCRSGLAHVEPGPHGRRNLMSGPARKLPEFDLNAWIYVLNLMEIPTGYGRATKEEIRHSLSFKYPDVTEAEVNRMLGRMEAAGFIEMVPTSEGMVAVLMQRSPAPEPDPEPSPTLWDHLDDEDTG